MPELFLLSPAQTQRMEPFFPRSPGLPVWMTAGW
jgi:hypothetical protein